MFFSASFVAVVASLASLTVSLPLEKRVDTPYVNDGTILNYALTLEYLERSFYRGGLERFKKEDFLTAGFTEEFYENFLEVRYDEETHVTFIHDALSRAGVQPTNELEYKFPYTDVHSFLGLASVLEGVGVSAYLGAAASIVNKDYLTVAGSILTVESRHNSYIRASLGESPFPVPFDTPLDFNEVYSLAAAFIVGGTSPVALPFSAFPTLTLQCTQYYYEADRSSVTFTGAAHLCKESQSVFAVFFSGLDKIAIPVKVTGKNLKIEKLPAGIAGQVYVVLSTSESPSDETILAGPAILEVYPKGQIPETAHAKCS